MRIYIAGPMRGIPLYNFLAFDEASRRGRELGHDIVSPADLDRILGFDAQSDIPSDHDLRDMIVRDVQALADCHAIALLPGWQRSSGTKVEFAVAKFLDLQILDAETFEPMELNWVQDYHTEGD